MMFPNPEFVLGLHISGGARIPHSQTNINRHTYKRHRNLQRLTVLRRLWSGRFSCLSNSVCLRPIRKPDAKSNVHSLLFFLVVDVPQELLIADSFIEFFPQG